MVMWNTHSKKSLWRDMSWDMKHVGQQTIKFLKAQVHTTIKFMSSTILNNDSFSVKLCAKCLDPNDNTSKSISQPNPLAGGVFQNWSPLIQMLMQKIGDPPIQTAD